MPTVLQIVGGGEAPKSKKRYADPVIPITNHNPHRPLLVVYVVYENKNLSDTRCLVPVPLSQKFIQGTVHLCPEFCCGLPPCER